MSDTHRFTINHSVTNPKESEAAAKARADREETAKTVRAQRKKIHEQARRDIAGAGIQEETKPAAPMPVREDIETIEVTLRDGRTVEYGPLTGISVMDRIARMFSGRSMAEGGPDPGVTEFRLTKILLGVRSINGRPTTFNDLIGRTKLANQLGDEAIDLLFHFDGLYWPPLTIAELPLVKKKPKIQPSSE